MLDQQDGHFKFIADVVDDLQQFLGLGGVHARRRFIEEQQLHIGGQRTGDLQAALLTIGQVVGLQVFLAGKVDDFEQFFGPLGDLGLLLPVLFGAEDGIGQAVGGVGLHGGLDILDDRHFFEQANVLEGAGNACVDDLVGLFAVHPLAAKVERSLGRLIDAGDKVEHGSLAGAVGADKPDQLGLSDFHIKIIHGF